MLKSLTTDQVRQFKEEGCLAPLRLMSEDEAREFRDRYEAFQVEHP